MLRVAEPHFERTDTGMQRRSNEDSYFARSPLFAVADGMGGAQAGEVASGIAVGVLDGGLPEGAGSVEQRLAGAVRDANALIYRRSVDEPELQGMGTTFSVAYLGEEELTLAHVGDSRVYRWRGGTLEQLTEDHSLVGELVREGRLTPEEAEEHPQRSIITRALGPAPDVEVDTHTWKAEADDVYLLCSDGLTAMIHEPQITEILRANPTLAGAGRALVDAANAAGGRDNITVILFRVEEVGGVGAAPTAQHALGETSVGAAELRVEDIRRAAEEDQRRAAEADARRRQPRVPEMSMAVPQKQRRRVPGWVKGTIALAAVLGVLLTAAYFASQTVYFLGTNGQGFVTMYRGVPYELPGGINLYTPNYTTGVNVDQLPVARRAALLDQRLRSRDDAVDLVHQIELGNITTP